MNCQICKRKLGKKVHSWCNELLGLENLKGICEECDLCVREQIYLIYEELQ